MTGRKKFNDEHYDSSDFEEQEVPQVTDSEEDEKEDNEEDLMVSEENSDDDDDDDDDDAPLDISLKKSREVALQQIQGALQQIRQEKDKSREKRKQKHELYTEQKKRKVNTLENCRLPQEFLDSLPPKPVASKAKTRKQKKGRDKQEETEEIDSIDEELIGDSTEAELDFIRLDRNAGIKAVPVSEVHIPRNAQDKALEFRNNLLYGNKVRRETTQSLLSKKKKRAARKAGHVK